MEEIAKANQLLNIAYIDVIQDERPTNELVSTLIGAKQTIDSKMATSQLSVFKVSSLVCSELFSNYSN